MSILSGSESRRFHYQLKLRTSEAKICDSLPPDKKKEFQQKWLSAPKFEFVEAFQNNSESFEKKSRTQNVYLTELELVGRMGRANVYIQKMKEAGRFYTDVADCGWFEVEQHSKEKVHNSVKALTTVRSSGSRRAQLALPAAPKNLLTLEDVAL